MYIHTYIHSFARYLAPLVYRAPDAPLFPFVHSWTNATPFYVPPSREIGYCEPRKYATRQKIRFSDLPKREETQVL